jgi:hypothetical protein
MYKQIITNYAIIIYKNIMHNLFFIINNLLYLPLFYCTDYIKYLHNSDGRFHLVKVDSSVSPFYRSTLQHLFLFILNEIYNAYFPLLKSELPKTFVL